MKEIFTIIRPKKVGQTKDALEKLGFVGLTANSVLGRGNQRGIAGELSCDIRPNEIAKGKQGGMQYIPKRLLSIVVNDIDVDIVVKAIIEINQTSQIGDGKIFVCPVDNGIRISTNDEGDKALL
ncbi:P-II family nitrogen regulator [Clostridium estertheticum]|uniref:P-II family nitrogen regulator n=1 Tax=Clostridium estertheticum TaxID=238834 RepID=UPI001CF5989A|nr:P-II family nitrogen regulator [Clostridium estertheticum]MCB2352632.1 P-II family nitrogen regulator [Clostridium estertheticum]WAG39944.1 P-II family nitrogen regulator [Clostridium estertheticum]